MDNAAWFIGGALWTLLGVTFLLLWASVKTGRALYKRDCRIGRTDGKLRCTLGILRDRDGRES
jgi:hypothetical protein